MISQTTHLRPDRTIEHITISHPFSSQKTYFVYNDHGLHFRVFSSQEHLSVFLNNQPHHLLAEFESETDLDAFLSCSFPS